MKKSLTLFVLLFSLFGYAQIGDNYYVNSSTLDLRNEPSLSSQVIKTLNKYDNLQVIDISTENEKWWKIKINNVEGYVYKSNIKKGKVSVYKYEVRTGAKCKDGTTSSATGRGACSHHGGVQYWITKSKSSVTIDD